MDESDQPLDVGVLTQAIDVLERPMVHQPAQVQQAQAFVDQYKIDHAKQVHMFFLTYYQFTERQSQHKFWTLSAISDVLNAAVQCRLLGSPSPVQLLKCRAVFMDLLRSKGHEVLTQLTIPKFGKILIMLIKLDNLNVNEQNAITRQWPEVISDLVTLVEASSDVNHQKTFIRFIVKTLQIFDEDIVERCQQKSVQEMQLSGLIKDYLREGQIPQIVTLIAQVLGNHSLFEKKTVKGTLKVLASLIDWNEIPLFDSCRDKIRDFLRQKQLRAGAFACLSSLVGKGMPELDKLTIIQSSGYLEEVRDAQFSLVKDFSFEQFQKAYAGLVKSFAARN